MTAEVVLHCDAPECPTHAQAGPLTHDWLTVLPGDDGEPLHFEDQRCLASMVKTWGGQPTVVEI